MATLTIVTQDGDETTFDVSPSGATIGRDEGNAIVVADASISGNHAEITVADGVFTIRDLGSTNGTKVGGERVETSEIQSGVSFMLGHATATLHAAPTKGNTPMPKDTSTTGAAPAASSSAPQNFANSSPFTKKVKKKDPKSQAVMAVGIVAIVACVISMALTLIMRSS